MSEETKTVPEKPVNKTLSVPSPILIIAFILFLRAVAIKLLRQFYSRISPQQKISKDSACSTL